MRAPTGACIVHVQKALLSTEVIVIVPVFPFSSILNSEQLDAVIKKVNIVLPKTELLMLK